MKAQVTSDGSCAGAGAAIEALAASPDLLGESPVWDGRLGCLYWVDSIAPRIRRLTLASGKVEDWPMPAPVGSIGLCAHPRQLVAALATGFFRVDLAGGGVTPLAAPGDLAPGTRFNDGKVDRQGRFVSGTLARHGMGAVGALHRLNRDLSVDTLAGDVNISNTLAFSPDGGTLYFADTLARAIWAYDYRAGPGGPGQRRVFAETASLKSGTDGAAIDSDGCLWVALVEVGKLARFTPAGALDRLIDVPVEYPSCPAFGGAGLDTLFVTSIKDTGSGRLVGKHPDSGKVFAIQNTGARGLPEPHFAG